MTGWPEVRMAYPERAGQQRWIDAKARFDERLAEGHTADSILYSVQSYKRFCDALGLTGTNEVMQARAYFADPEAKGRSKSGFLTDWDERIVRRLK